MFYELANNQQWILDRVNLFVALAPIANMANSTVLHPITDFLNTIWEATRLAGVYEVFNPKIKQEFVDLSATPLGSWLGIL